MVEIKMKTADRILYAQERMRLHYTFETRLKLNQEVDKLRKGVYLLYSTYIILRALHVYIQRW